MPFVLAFVVPKTDVPETDTPETDAPQTDVPETDVPETDVPERDGELLFFFRPREGGRRRRRRQMSPRHKCVVVVLLQHFGKLEWIVCILLEFMFNVINKSTFSMLVFPNHDSQYFYAKKKQIGRNWVTLSTTPYI